MAIQVTCACGRSCNFPDAQAGQTARCVYCGQLLNIPQIGAPGTPAKAEDDLNLQMSQPSQHVAVSNAAPKPVLRPISPKASPPAHAAQVSGMGLGRLIFWGVTGAVVLLVVFGVYSLVHWWNMSEYEGYLAGGDDWMAKGYLTDAEINFKKAQAIFPKDPRTANAFKRLAQAEEDRKRNPRSVNAVFGPIAAPAMIPPEAQLRLQQAQQMMNQAQALQESRQREIERRVREEREFIPPIRPTSAPVNPSTKANNAAEARRAQEEANRIAEKKALAEAQRQEAWRKAEEARNLEIQEAARKAEERRAKEDADRKAREEEKAKRQSLVLLGQLSTWSNNVMQQVAPRTAVSTSWASSRDVDDLAASARQAIAETDTEEVTVPQAAILEKIEDIQDGPALAEFSKSLPRLILQAEETRAAARGAKTVARNQIDKSLRSYAPLVQLEAQLQSQYGDDVVAKRKTLAADKERLGAKLRDQCAAYVKGLSDMRAAKAAHDQLQEAKKLCAARLQTLGVAVSPVTPAAPPKVKTYVLKDGSEIKAVTVAATGDQLIIKDEAGKMHTIEQANVKETR